MLYKFKSRATADVIMLEPNGRQLLQIIGKSPDPHGIVTAAQIPAAIEALEAAVASEEAQRSQRTAETSAQDKKDEEPQERGESVSLRQRAMPLIDILRRSAAEGYDVTW